MGGEAEDWATLVGFLGGNVKIAMFGCRSYPSVHGGIEIAVRELSLELAALGHQVTVFVDRGSRPESDHDNVLIRASPALRMKYTHTASQIVLNVLSLPRGKYDVVHVHGVGPAFPLALCRNAFKGLPTVITVHGIDWDREKWPVPARLIFRTIALRALTNAGAVTAVSGSDSEMIQRMIGLPVTQISNGMPSLPFEEHALERAKYSVYVGRLTPEKNIDGLIREYDHEVAAKLGPLHILGSGVSSHSSKYEQHLRKTAPPWVQFEGLKSHEDTLACLARAGRFISLSRLEGQPLAVMEALALQTPVFVSDIPAHRELCGAAATYIPVKASGELRKMLLADQGIPNTTRADALQHRFTWSDAARCYEKLYQAASRTIR